ncbi:9891_t:CDS:2, partial [Racocetra persica]
QSTLSVASSHLSTPRANASFTRFFYQDDETDNTIAYCRLCTQELDELDRIQAQPFTEQMVYLLKLFEEITRYVCGSKYPTLNLVYCYIRTLKNKFALKNDHGKSFEAWVNLIYGSEDADTSNDSSLSSDNEVDIPLAENRRQWQYAHRSAYRCKGHEQTEAQIRAELLLLKTQLDDSNSNENIERSSIILNEVTLNKDPQDSLSAELW